MRTAVAHAAPPIARRGGRRREAAGGGASASRAAQPTAAARGTVKLIQCIAQPPAAPAGRPSVPAPKARGAASELPHPPVEEAQCRRRLPLVPQRPAQGGSRHGNQRVTENRRARRRRHPVPPRRGAGPKPGCRVLHPARRPAGAHLIQSGSHPAGGLAHHVAAGRTDESRAHWGRTEVGVVPGGRAGAQPAERPRPPAGSAARASASCARRTTPGGGQGARIITGSSREGRACGKAAPYVVVRPDHGVADRIHHVVNAHRVPRRRDLRRVASRDEQAKQPRRGTACRSKPHLRRRLVGRVCAFDGMRRKLQEMRSGHPHEQQHHAQAQHKELGINLASVPGRLQLVQQAVKRLKQRDGPPRGSRRVKFWQQVVRSLAQQPITAGELAARGSERLASRGASRHVTRAPHGGVGGLVGWWADGLEWSPWAQLLLLTQGVAGTATCNNAAPRGAHASMRAALESM
eukprot:scaffold15975_cov87-Isochrysis_galbana.AAC.1